MAQACDGYTRGSLMGNWYEERLAPTQPFRDNIDSKDQRPVEECISFPSDTNKLLPLARIKRNQPWVTQGIVADDGFKEFRSNVATTFDQKNLDNFWSKGDCRDIVKKQSSLNQYPENNKSTIQTHHKHNYIMLTANNIIQLEKKRDVDVNVTDFGSTFKKHPENHSKLYGITTYSKSFQKPQLDMPIEVLDKNAVLKELYSGCNERPQEETGLKTTSVVTGEKYKCMYDPKDNTSIQRSWLHCKDKALQVAENNIEKNSQMLNETGTQIYDPLQTYKKTTNQVLNYDIETSLPIGAGTSPYPEQVNVGQFRRKKTDITTVRNQPITKK